MSKGINLFNHFNPSKPTHKRVIGEDKITIFVKCPKASHNDIISTYHTSNGLKCSQCNQSI
jgi:hypothetical protein